MASADWPQQRNRMLQLSNAESHRLTRECIEQALVELLKTRKFQGITITDITNKAGVSRAAFYRNYDSREAVLRALVSGGSEAIVAHMQECRTEGEPRLFWKALFEGIAERADICKTLFQAGQGETLLEIYGEVLPDYPMKVYNLSPYHLHFWTGAIYNVTREWVLGGMKESIDEMADFLTQMMER